MHLLAECLCAGKRQLPSNLEQKRSIRPCSVDFMDGGATDVPILGPMELKNCISVFYDPTDL